MLDGRWKVKASSSYGILGMETLADMFPEGAGRGGRFGFKDFGKLQLIKMTCSFQALLHHFEVGVLVPGGLPVAYG